MAKRKPLTTNPPNELTLERVEEILGEKTCFVPCAWGTETAKVKLTTLSLEATKQRRYRQAFAKGPLNIGVVLGPLSNALCAVRFRDPKKFAQFIRDNEILRYAPRVDAGDETTLFFRAMGDVPVGCKSPEFEWLSDGQVAVVSGQHAGGSDYKVVSDGPLEELDFARVNWPEIWNLPWNGEMHVNGDADPAERAIQKIPEKPFANRLEAARYYRDQLGWAVHPLHGPKDPSVAEKERGKKPLFKNWKEWHVSDATESVFRRYFGETSDANPGVVVRKPNVVVDIDSKPDKGQSVMAWLAEHPELASVPRERTQGGVHLHFVCDDLPPMTKGGKPYGQALVAKLNEHVTAELFFDGLTIVVSPSVHFTGHVYRWEVTGGIPETTWAWLQSTFGFRHPEEKTEKNSGKSQDKTPWFETYHGDLATLDLLQLFKSQAMLGDVLSADQNKIAVVCPWRNEHSKGQDNPSSTVIFQGEDGFPGFKCLHSHCAERGLEQVLAWFDQREPGIVDRHCKRMRVWQEGQSAEDGKRPRVLLPGDGRPLSQFAEKVGKLVGPKRQWFCHGNQVVEVRLKDFSESVRCQAFHELRPAEVCTAIEQFVELGFLRKDKKGNRVFVPRSTDKTTSDVLISSPQFRQLLPQVRRILGVQTPIIYNGEITLPKQGYDERFCTYTDPNSPKVIPMGPDEAKALLYDILTDFPFETDQSRIHAFARIITPACRGIMGWDARPPFWLFTANCSRAGKDYLAGIASILYDGYANEDAPIDNHNSNETAKRFTAALLSGRAMVHLANCKGHIQDPALEQVITAKVWSARLLGGNSSHNDISLPNELEISMSGNIPITYTADLSNRCRRIALFYPGEHANERQFKRYDLHAYVKENRSRILSAIYALIRNWWETGRKPGLTPFASFPEWARTVGGIMGTNGLGDPCLRDDAPLVGGDQTTGDMKTLFVVAHEKWGWARIKVKEIRELVQDHDSGLFSWMQLEETSGKTKFGITLRTFVGRILGGIRLNLHDRDKKEQSYSFEPVENGPQKPPIRPENALNGVDEPPGTPKSGDLGDLGDLFTPGNVSVGSNFEVEKSSECGSVHEMEWEKVPEVPEVPVQTKPRLITEREELAGIAEILRNQAKTVSLDIETYGSRKTDALDPFKGEIRLLALAIPGHEPWLIDLKAIGYDLGPLKPALECQQVVGHNIKFDLLWLRVKCGLRISLVFCTQTASRLITNGSNLTNDLGECLRRHLQIDLPKDQAKSNWGAPILSHEQIAYSASDVAHLHALKARLEADLEANGLSQVARLEMDLLPVVIDMEARGVFVDRDKLRVLYNAAKAQVDALTTKMRHELGDPAFNPNSPKQLLQKFQAHGISLPGTAEDILASCQHPLASLVLEYREAQKRAEQAETLLDAAGPDGRIHTTFNPVGAKTGRFSSKKPNLQNVGRGELRSCFIGSPDHLMVIADYSQIELRIAAAIAEERRMVSAYQQNADLHKQTASLVLSKPLEQVSKQDRQLAKAVNFGLLYGQSAEGLVRFAKTDYGLELTTLEAERFRHRFFAAYPDIARWHQRAWNSAKKGATEVRTITGRRQLLPKETTTDWKRFNGLVNTRVQGSSADGLKLAMIDLAKKLPSGAHLVSTVHDELIIETPEELAEQVRELVQTTMVEAMARLFPQVPIEVEAKIATNWGEK